MVLPCIALHSASSAPESLVTQVTGGSALRYIALHCRALHCMGLHCIALHCIILHCIALPCIALHFILLALKANFGFRFNVELLVAHFSHACMHSQLLLYAPSETLTFVTFVFGPSEKHTKNHLTFEVIHFCPRSPAKSTFAPPICVSLGTCDKNWS